MLWYTMEFPHLYIYQLQQRPSPQVTVGHLLMLSDLEVGLSQFYRNPGTVGIVPTPGNFPILKKILIPGG